MSLIRLQEIMGIKPDGNFGPITLKTATKFFNLNNVESAHFFGQLSHETGNFKTFSENLNYSTQGLLTTFKKYFPTKELADQYARNPERIANRVYANRMGNGPESSGDGWKYRGRGAIQLTGKFNYGEFSKYIKEPSVMDNPNIVSTDYSFDSAIFFFHKNKLWDICNKGVNRETITSLTKRINGGVNGLEDRIEKTIKYYELLQK
jgi:putative chitinase